MRRKIDTQWSPFLPHQWDYFAFDPPDPSATEVAAILGGWGSGKTEGLIRKAFRIAALNPWSPDYGDDNPKGVIEAPTFGIMQISIVPLIKRLWPKQAILKWRKSHPQFIELTNGFRYYLFSGEGEMEGASLAAYVITEISHPTYASNPTAYLNKLARLRDRHARRRAMLVDGLPVSGFVRDTFGDPNPNSITILAGTNQNPHLPKSTIQTFYEACPDGHQKTLLGGQWMSPQGAIYSQFSPDVHLTDTLQPNLRQPVHLGIDPGSQTSIVVGQEINVTCRNIVGQTSTERGLLIVDNLVLKDSSVDAALYEFKLKTHWQLVPGQSTISIDPKSMKEVKLAVRKHFPGIKIIQRDRGDQYEPVEAGIQLVQSQLRDALGNVRLYFHRPLAKVRLGVVDFMTRYRRNELTERPVKDNMRDHAGDALRYLVCSVLGKKPVGLQVR